jgi:hypothetical protein
MLLSGRSGMIFRALLFIKWAMLALDYEKNAWMKIDSVAA